MPVYLQLFQHQLSSFLEHKFIALFCPFVDPRHYTRYNTWHDPWNNSGYYTWYNAGDNPDPQFVSLVLVPFVDSRHYTRYDPWNDTGYHSGLLLALFIVPFVHPRNHARYHAGDDDHRLIPIVFVRLVHTRHDPWNDTGADTWHYAHAVRFIQFLLRGREQVLR